MRGVRIPQDLNGEDQFLLGLSVSRLAALLLGLLGAYTVLHLALPSPIRIGGAAFAAIAGAVVTWVRPAGRSLIHWAIAAIEFKLDTRFAPQNDSPSTLVSDQESTSHTLSIDGRQPHLQLVQAHESIAAAAEGPVVETTDEDVVELPDSRATQLLHTSPVEESAGVWAPVYLGGTQIIVFFSAKGGVGRTTLATEVATLLALKGQYRNSAAGPVQRLKVALIDFDLGSANVSTRLGLAQPTMLDYLCDASTQNPNPLDFVIRDPATNVDVLLGPSKCLAGDRAELMGIAQAAHLLSSFKAAGYHFILLDISAAIGDLETYLLEASTRIYCVVTPTAGSVQSLYRGVEALRRLGLGSKLQYVANKMREGVSLSEPMSDLNGSLVARIPYDAAFETAENRHRPISLQAGSAPNDGLARLASSIYPALDLPHARPSGGSLFTWFGRRRRAG